MERQHYRAKGTNEFAHESFKCKFESLKIMVIKLHWGLKYTGRIVTPGLLTGELNKK
jgi:hypothetical protein